VSKTLVAEVYKLHGTASVSIPADSPLEKVISTFVREPSLRGVFLVDSKDRFVGMVTRVDLIRWAHLNLTGGKGRHEIPVSVTGATLDMQQNSTVVVFLTYVGAEPDGKQYSVRGCRCTILGSVESKSLIYSPALSLVLS